MAKRYYPYKKMTFHTKKGRLISVEKYRELTFTNDVLKTMAQTGSYEGTVLIADRQSAPRGTLSKKHFPDTQAGLHMSILLRPALSVNQSLLLTSMMAVAVVRAIRSMTDVDLGIKWVNDIFYKKKKISGILAEGVVNSENGFDYVIIGVSVNLLSSVFPTRLADIVAEFFSEEREGMVDKLAHTILDEFFLMYESFNMDNSFIEEYKSLSILDGKKVHVIINKERESATVLGINSDAHLEVRLKNGELYTLNSTAELAE